MAGHLKIVRNHTYYIIQPRLSGFLFQRCCVEADKHWINKLYLNIGLVACQFGTHAKRKFRSFIGQKVIMVLNVLGFIDFVENLEMLQIYADIL